MNDENEKPLKLERGEPGNLFDNIKWWRNHRPDDLRTDALILQDLMREHSKIIDQFVRDFTKSWMEFKEQTWGDENELHRFKIDWTLKYRKLLLRLNIEAENLAKATKHKREVDFLKEFEVTRLGIFGRAGDDAL